MDSEVRELAVEHLTPSESSLHIVPRVQEGIASEELAGVKASPGRGSEVGGILLGRRTETEIIVDDFEPVLCEHRFGPSYLLSDEDGQGLNESLEWFQRTRGQQSILGFYRSHTREGFPLDEQDAELFRRHFPSPEAVFLLLRPDRRKTISAEFFTRSEHGVLRSSAGPLPFHKESAAEAQEASPRSLPAPTRPRFETADESSGSRRQWIAVAALLCLAGVLLWAIGVHRPAAKRTSGRAREIAQAPLPPRIAMPPLIPTQNPPDPPALQQASASRLAPDPVPEPPPDALADARATMDRWVRAMRSGDPKAVGALYAARIDPYFKERDVSNAWIRRSVAQSVSEFGKPVILRLADLEITPVHNDRAVATFRKHWQTSGTHLYSGEADERLGLVKTRNGWKIDSEEETQVLWTHRGR